MIHSHVVNFSHVSAHIWASSQENMSSVPSLLKPSCCQATETIAIILKARLAIIYNFKKGADQAAHMRSLISAFVVRHVRTMYFHQNLKIKDLHYRI